MNWILLSELFLFGLFIISMSVYKTGIGFAKYKILVTDIALLFILISNWKSLRPNKLICSILILMLFLLPGIFVCINPVFFWSGFLPLIYAGSILLLIPNIMHKYEKYLFSLIISGLVIVCIPAYVEIISNIKIPFFHYRTEGWNRYAGWSLNPNRFSNYVMCYYWIILISEYYKKKLFSPQSLFLLGFISIPVFLAGSKAFIILLLFTYIFALIYLLLQKNIKQAIFALSFIFLSSIFISVAVNSEQYRYPFNRMIRFNKYAQGDSILDKILNERKITEGLEVFAQNKFVGVGLGNFTFYRKASGSVHNMFISILAEGGIIGFLGLLIFFTFFIKEVAFNPHIHIPVFIICLFIFIANLSGNYLFERWTIFLIAIGYYYNSKYSVDA